MSFLILEFLPWMLSSVGMEPVLANIWLTAAGAAEGVIQKEIEWRSAKRQKTGIGSARRVTGSAPAGEGFPQIVGSDPFHRVTGSAPGQSTVIRIPQRITFPNNNMSDNVSPLVKAYITVNKKVKETMGEYVYHYRADNFTQSSLEGQKAVNTVAFFGTSSQWTINTGAAVNALQSPVAWLSLNPAVGIPAGTRYAALLEAKDNEFALEYMTNIFEFVNLGNTPAICELIAYKAKKQNTDAVTALQLDSYSDLIALPDTALVIPAAGIQPTAANFGGATSLLPWAADGADVRSLNMHYGKLDGWKFQLPSGGRLILKIGVNFNMIGNKNDLADELFYPKGSLQYTFSNFGAPVETTAVGSGGPGVGQVTHAVSKVGCVVTSMLKFKCLLDKTGAGDKRYTAFYNLAANNAAGTETFMDTDVNDTSVVKIVP